MVPDEDLPELVRKLRELSAVLVSDEFGRESVLTTHGVLGALAEIAEPFLLVADIEESIRTILDACLPATRRPATFERHLGELYGGRPVPQGLRDLAMGDYVRLINAKELWEGFKPALKSKDIANQKLETTTRLRNQIFHFREPLDEDDLKELSQLRWWFGEARDRARRARLSVVDGAAAG